MGILFIPMFFAGMVMVFVIAGLNFRFQWIVLPEWVSWTGVVIFLFSYLLYAEVLRENTYLSLGSIISFAIFLTYPLIIAKRIRNVEAVLEENLDGYIEYKKKVKYKMIPYC